MITGILSGVAAMLAGLTVAAKAAVGIGVATAAIGAASVAGVVPVPGTDSGVSKPAVEVQLPSVPTANADSGLATADDAVSATTGKPGVPPADHLPSNVPGPPDSVPPANTGAAATGLDRAAQTPAADHLPTFVPGPPAGIPTGGAVPGAPGATGTDIAAQTPAAGHLPR